MVNLAEMAIGVARMGCRNRMVRLCKRSCEPILRVCAMHKEYQPPLAEYRLKYEMGIAWVGNFQLFHK